MQSTKVSVVIPVYNTEDFVEEAVRSIMNQTLRDIEIIIINDGSTDASSDIIQKLSNEDIRIRIYSQENQGLSATRNRGISLASGNYIYFMDSDDYLELNALETCLYKCEQNKLDFVFFDADILNKKNNFSIDLKYDRNDCIDEKQLYDGIYLLNTLLDNKCYFPSVWLNFISLDYLRQTKNLFLSGIIHEDQLFTCILYLEAKRIMYIKERFFKRRLRDNSIMTQQFSLRNMSCYFIVSDHLLAYAVIHPATKTTIDKLLSQMLDAAAWLSYRLPLKDRLYVASQYILKFRKYVSTRNMLILLFKRLIKS